MKLPTLLIAGSAILLSACQSGQPSFGPDGEKQLNNIRHICILGKTENANPELDRQIARSLSQYGITSEIVDTAAGRKRLYDPECRYNLRYNTKGSGKDMNYISLLIRTPDHPVVSLRARPDLKASQNPQTEIDGIIGRLLNKK